MKAIEKEKLWEEYQKNPTPKLREQLIIEYAQLVRLVAGRLSMYLGHNVEYDDLVSYGIFGLIDAIDKFNLEKNVKFETYASLRIRGAILDQIRKMDWIPRTVRQRQRKIDEAIKNIELRTGKTANDADLAKELSISEDELCSWQSQLKVTNVVSLDEFDESGPEPVMDAAHNSHYAQPEEIVTQEELKTMLVKSLDNLTEKERRVIELYYYPCRPRRLPPQGRPARRHRSRQRSAAAVHRRRGCRFHQGSAPELRPYRRCHPPAGRWRRALPQDAAGGWGRA